MTTIMEGDPVKSAPTMRARHLGLELARLRVARDLTQDFVAGELGISAATLSRFETGDRIPKPLHLMALARIYGMSHELVKQLIAVAEQAKVPGWWLEYGATVPKYFGNYLGMETEASELDVHTVNVIPGLLQTRRYAEAVTPDVNAVRLRLERQSRLTDDDPLSLTAVIDETALRCMVGDADLMMEQYRHLLDVVEASQADVRILPFGAGLNRVKSAFTGITLADSADPNGEYSCVYIELMNGAVYLEKPGDVRVYREAFEELIAGSLGGEEVTRFLAEFTRPG